MTVTEKDIEKFENEYWCDMVDAEGNISVTPEWLKQEMLDYYMLMKNSSIVYGAITSGKIRDTRSDADVVLNEAASIVALHINDIVESIIYQYSNDKNNKE